jgi:hypothetical protein
MIANLGMICFRAFKSRGMMIPIVNVQGYLVQRHFIIMASDIVFDVHDKYVLTHTALHSFH